ncbi:MAG: Crp/Fnr family transcriptional regulator [Bacteroidetes bacterium]|nr:Crp/Fnr family transcriptional regulator [Bacteroidota bacterium]
MTDNSITSTCKVVNSHCRCFDVLTEDQKELLDKKQVEVKFRKGEIIAKHGAFATHVIFLCDGLVKVFLEDNDQTLILKIIGPGSLVGLNALSDDGDTFRYTAAAYQDSVARLIDINTFKYLVRENGIFASRIINIMSEDANLINNRFFFMTHRQSYGRLADLLLCLSGNIFKSQVFDLHLTRKELAELAGMSTENVIRILKNFQEDGLVEITGKTIAIKDGAGLRKLCHVG